MATYKLFDGPVSVTGLKVKADRKVCQETVIYEPHGSSGASLDVNTLVYELMIIAAYDQLKSGRTVYGGDYTAAELAGKVSVIDMFMDNADPDWEEYPTVNIRTKTFCCSFHAGQTFSTIAEWEGVMGLPSKKQHRFHVDGKEKPACTVIKPYTRCRGYRPTPISLASYNASLNKRFETLGQMRRTLTFEGMRKALSLLTAVEVVKRKHGADMADMADRLMRRWHWDIYGTTTDMSTVCFTARDFDYAPECYRQVDESYAKELLGRFREFMNENAAPEWIHKDMLVQLKDQDKQCKKWQGRLKVSMVYGQMDYYCKSVTWYAEVCTTKGRFDSMTRSVECLEAAAEEKPVKKGKAKAPKVKAVRKAPSPMELAERLRQALLRNVA